MPEQIPERPNGFAAHEAIRVLREATQTLHDFFGLSAATMGMLHVADPGDPHWYRWDSQVQFLDAALLRSGEKPMEDLFGRYTVLEEIRRGDLVYFKLLDNTTELHLIVYALDEVKDPALVQKIKERINQTPPKREVEITLTEHKDYDNRVLPIDDTPETLTPQLAHTAIASGGYASLHWYFTGHTSGSAISNALNRHWFKHAGHLYTMKSGEGPEIKWTRHLIHYEHRRTGLVYLEISHPDIQDHVIMLFDASNETHDEPTKRMVVEQRGDSYTPEAAPPASLTREIVHRDLRLGLHGAYHRYFTGKSKIHTIHDALDKRWLYLSSTDSFYVEHELDSIVTWTKLRAVAIHRKDGFVYAHTKHPDNLDDIIAIHDEGNEVHDEHTKKIAREVGG